MFANSAKILAAVKKFKSELDAGTIEIPPDAPDHIPDVEQGNVAIIDGKDVPIIFDAKKWEITVDTGN